YMTSWKMGLKAVAVYRDGSKKVQPMSVSSAKGKQKDDAAPGAAPEAKPANPAAVAGSSQAASTSKKLARRNKLPETRDAITHKFSIGGHEGYITVGKYEDGQLGEIFIVMAKEGSTVSGLMDSFATAISLALQYGVPLKVLVDKFSHTRFEPSGWTGNKDIPFPKSIMDYIFRWLSLKFLPGYEPSDAGASRESAKADPLAAPITAATPS